MSKTKITLEFEIEIFEREHRKINDELILDVVEAVARALGVMKGEIQSGVRLELKDVK